MNVRHPMFVVKAFALTPKEVTNVLVLLATKQIVMEPSVKVESLIYFK